MLVNTNSCHLQSSESKLGAGEIVGGMLAIKYEKFGFSLSLTSK